MRHFASTAAIGFLLAGCATSPRYEMYQVTAPTNFDARDIDTYCLQATMVRIEKSGTGKDAAGKATDEISITPVVLDDLAAAAKIPDYRPFKIGMRRNDSLGVRTNLNLTKFPNTCLPSAAGVEVIDKRIEMINTAASIVKTIIPIVLAAESTGFLDPAQLPLEINTLEVMTLAPQTAGRRGPLKFTTADGVTLEFGAVAPDALERAQLPAARAMKGMVYSACRQAVVSFEILDEANKRIRHMKRIAVSDPAFVQFVAFPQKGTVSFHSQCGVSVSSDKETAVASDLAIAEAFVNQAKAIKDAVDAAVGDE
jgi:hypothetical protein